MNTNPSRNQKCPCGSGRKFKNCHGRVGKGRSLRMSFEFKKILFGSDNDRECGIYLVGDLFDASSHYPFWLFMVPLSNGEWRLKRLDWQHKPQHINMTGVAQALINKASVFVKTTNLWAGGQTQSGAKIIMNQILVPDEAISTNTISFRSGLLKMPSPNWSEMWNRIDSRVSTDRYFRVHGFSKEEVKIAINALRNVFPHEWVKARYAAASTTDDPPGMGDNFPPEEKNSWFPAYHLARTALGAICVDPGWNYLVEIGLSIEELKGFKEIEILLRKLSRSPGTQHHLCLAAELYKKGYLVGLEPSTGLGIAKNDLSVSINGNHYAVEVKEFTSKDPIKALKRKLGDKSEKLPNPPSCPVIFHVVLREEGVKDIMKEKAFFESLESIESEIPPNISAVVAGSRFVDAMGGRVKRNTNKIILNPNPKLESKLEDIEVLFEKNYSQINYPCYGIGTFFYFENN